ncbi:MAG: hypothetical protein AB1546_06690 [bacterium]
MKNRRITVFILSILLASLLLLADNTTPAEQDALSEKFSLYYIQEEANVPLERYLTDNTPPLVSSVKVSPQNPTPDDEILIEAKIENNASLTDNEPLYASLYYSEDDGETWTEVELDQNIKSKNQWIATLKPVGKEGKYPFFFSAKDEAGNILLELPSTPIEWGGKEAPKLFGKITDKNDDERLVNADLDILETGIGYDGDILYFGVRVEGEISGGTITPFNPYIYSVGVYYPYEERRRTFKADFVLAHGQHAQFMLFPVIGLLDVYKNLAEVTDADARYYTDDGWLYMRIKQKALKDGKFNRLLVIFGTAMALGERPLILKPIDVSPFINIVGVNRAFEVKE